MVSKDYLSFSKRERTGIITLIILLIIVAIVPKFICQPRQVVKKIPDKQLQQLAERKPNYYPETKYRKPDTVYVRKYISSRYPYKKNPRYSEPAKSLFYPTKHESRRRANSAKAMAAEPGWIRPKSTPIDINTADTTAFIALPGIGSKLANRIISFRTKLGGFNSIEQIRMVYGLQDSVFQLIQPMLTCVVPNPGGG